MNLRAVIAAVLLAGVAFVSPTAGFTLHGAKWGVPTVTMHLQLGAGGGVLLDGFLNWNAAAEDALLLWNNYINATKFSVVRESTAGRASGNRINNVFFSNTVNGQAWGTNVVAVTLMHTSGQTLVETDVVFNSNLTWNSYRGALRSNSSGGTLHDFHRVALHEFGHALGLGHPDEAGQNVLAVMNSQVSSTDALTGDDISGAQSLYGSSANTYPPSIVVQPTSRSVEAGQSTTFNVTAVGAPPLTYRWTKSGNTLAGATAASYILSNVTSGDAGAYAVVVSNPSGSVTSATAILTVTTPGAPPPPPPPPPPPSAPETLPPAILVAPASQTGNAGSSVSFYVVASGTAPLFYQWRKDGLPLVGANASVYTISSLQPSHAGSYGVSVSNSAGSVTSNSATLVVHAQPVIVTPPADQTVTVGGTLRLSVVATGTSLTYAWRKDGTLLAGASSSTYEVSNAQPAHSGLYTVAVTGVGGSVTSSPARINVVAAAPLIATAPASQTALSGERAAFTVVVASGTPPFTYQWLKDGNDLAGANGSTYALDPVRAADAGGYSVRVSNSAGSTTSAVATLTVRSSRLVNVSTRAFVPAGGTLTPGFFIRGAGSKPLLIRGIGPTLRLFGVNDALSETRLEVIGQGDTEPVPNDREPSARSDNEVAAIVGAFPLEPDTRDASVQATLAPRGYTVRVSPGSSTMAGIALAEIYDADAPAAAAQLINVSTLGFVGAGENVLTAGFVVSGNAPKPLLIRAVGPGLATFGVAGALPNPQVALLRPGTSEPLAMNDNWSDTAEMRGAFTTAGAFSLPSGGNDAALLVTLEPGAYTVIVSSVTASVTGVALVEIYDLKP